MYDNCVNMVDWSGTQALSFGICGYEALIIPGLGANIIRLRNNVMGVDLLRTPYSYDTLTKSPLVYGMPVLFPPNRIKGGVFAACNNTYELPI